MCDTIEIIYGSVIQHGKHNDRIYVMQLDTAAEDDLLPELDQLGRDKGYRKILAKIPATSWQTFQSAGYSKEAEIPLLFSGRNSCFFVGKFFCTSHHFKDDLTVLQQIIEKKVSHHVGNTTRKDQHQVQRCSFADTEELALFYQQTFVSYPFPIHEPAYLAKMMNQDVNYYCIRNCNKIIAVAASDISPVNGYAEITDFATDPDWRKKGLATVLLDRIERELESAEVLTAFTIARAVSYGMNMVFKKYGYHYSGLLMNNTQIGGKIESMSVWYKHLQKHHT